MECENADITTAFSENPKAHNKEEKTFTSR